MAKSIPTNIAQAMACARKVEMGRPCTLNEMKATIRLLKQGLSASRSAVKVAKQGLRKSEDMVKSLINRVV